MASGVTIYGDQEQVPAVLRERFEKLAGKHWNLFYKRNQQNFFKDRHYLELEFDAQLGPDAKDGTDEERVLLEVGCGVGNTVYPLIESKPKLKVHCFDFSAEAVKLVKAHPKYEENMDRVNAFVCDATKDDLGENVPLASVDLVTLIFVLSAIPPEKLVQSIENIAKTLRPGAEVLLRDYAVGDLAEERLDKKKAARKLGENYYIRGDGTFCVYFSEDQLVRLFESTGLFKCLSITTCRKDIENRKKRLTMKRSWVQAVFQYRGPSDRTEYEWLRENQPGTSLFLEEERHTHEESILLSEEVPPITLVSMHRENMHSVPSTGLMVWEGAKALSSLVLSCADCFESKQVVELGCGCAPLCSIALGLVGAKTILATDGNPDALKMFQQNVAANRSSSEWWERIQTKVLPWDDSAASGDSQHFDIVLASDVLYIEDAIPSLFQQAARLLAQTPGSFFLICYTPRRAIESKAVAAAEQAGLAQEQVGQTFREALEKQERKNSMRLLQFRWNL